MEIVFELILALFLAVCLAAFVWHLWRHRNDPDFLDIDYEKERKDLEYRQYLDTVLECRERRDWCERMLLALLLIEKTKCQDNGES